MREAPDVREVRTSTEEYLRVLVKGDVKGVAERSTCLVGAGTLVGGQILRIEPPRTISMAMLDSLVKDAVGNQKSADSAWAYADEITADSLFQRARLIALRSAVYRNAVRAVSLSAPGTVVGRDSTVETRVVRARFRYAGAAIGPKAVDREEILRLVRAPAGKWIVFSVYLVPDDPRPEMI